MAMEEAVHPVGQGGLHVLAKGFLLLEVPAARGACCTRLQGWLHKDRSLHAAEGPAWLQEHWEEPWTAWWATMMLILFWCCLPAGAVLPAAPQAA